MSTILKQIELFSQECFPAGKPWEEWAEVVEEQTGEKLYIPGPSAYNAMLLGIKKLGYTGKITLVQERESWSRGNEELVSYATYQLQANGMVHRIEHVGGMQYACERAVG